MGHAEFGIIPVHDIARDCLKPNFIQNEVQNAPGTEICTSLDGRLQSTLLLFHFIVRRGHTGHKTMHKVLFLLYIIVLRGHTGHKTTHKTMRLDDAGR
jgi:hypothetical protein